MSDQNILGELDLVDLEGKTIAQAKEILSQYPDGSVFTLVPRRPEYVEEDFLRIIEG